MPKHQTCRGCGYDFVGPDSNIGENLCDSCEEELYGEHNRELDRLHSIAQECLDYLEELGEVIRRDDGTWYWTATGNTVGQ